MDPHFTPGSSLSHCSELSTSYDEQDVSTSLLQVESLLSSIQSNGAKECSNIHESSFHESNLTPLHDLEFEDLPILQFDDLVPNTSNHQSLLFDSPSIPLEVPFPTHPDDANTPLAVSSLYTYPVGRRGASRQVELAKIENDNPLSPPQDIYGDPGPFAPPESMRFGVQDDYADAFPHGQAEDATLSLMATQGQNPTTQE